MSKLQFTFEDSAWETMLQVLGKGDSLSAAQFLTWMEPEDEATVEDALLELEKKGITLDVSELPKTFGSGETALRLRREAQLAEQGNLMTALEENDPLMLYLQELASIPTCEDPDVLAMECAQGKTASRERLLNARLYRVVELAKELVGRGVLLLDLIQEGSLGLWQAITQYRGGDFAAQSDWWIRQTMAKIITLQARANGVGQKMRQALEDYRAVDERLLSELGRNATIEEIALELHMGAEEASMVKNTLDSARLVSQVKSHTEDKGETAEEEQHVEDTAYFQMRQRIMELLSVLGETDAKLLTLRFGLEGGLPLSPEETGKKLGMTPEEVVAREANALNRLRKG